MRQDEDTLVQLQEQRAEARAAGVQGADASPSDQVDRAAAQVGVRELQS